MKTLKLLSSLALASSLALGACAADVGSYNNDGSKYDDQEATKYVGLWTGVDQSDSDCQVEVLAYEEHIDAKIPGVEAELAAQDLSKLRRSMRLKLSLQESEDTTFAAVSMFDEQATAYVNQRLTGSNTIDDVSSEDIVVILDPEAETLSAVNYTKGEANRCKDLQFHSDSLDPEKDPEEAPQDPETPDEPFVPHERGSARR